MQPYSDILANIFLNQEMVAIKKQPVQAQRDFFTARAKTLFDLVAKPAYQLDKHDIPLEGRHLSAWCYTPEKCDYTGAIVFYHGGGWMLHDSEVYQLFCAYLSDKTKAKVISVDYRLAPEHPFPAGVKDAIEAYDWIVKQPETFKIDTRNLVIAGDSAGGNLTAEVCHHRAFYNLTMPVAQVLIYPATDLLNTYPSQQAFADHQYSLNDTWYQMMVDHYFSGDLTQASNPLASPVLYNDFSAQPPTKLIIADYDPLRDEGLAYGEKLSEAGVELDTEHFPSMAHGFITFISVVDEAMQATESIARFCQQHFRH